VTAFGALKSYFSRAPDVVAAYLYGKYADDRTWPDSDLEVAILFAERLSEDEISDHLQRVAAARPLGEAPGILLPFALNTHILPVVYEVLTGAEPLVTNDPSAAAAFAKQATSRLEDERATILSNAEEAILQARKLGLHVVGSTSVVLPQPPRPLDPIRIGWRLARILGSAAVLEPATRDPEAAARDPDSLGQIIGWFSNAAGAATGIAKAMLNIFSMPRPSRRWEIFLPLADVNLLTMELALQLGALVELRWRLLAGAGLATSDRLTASIRGSLPPILSFARLAALYCEVPGVKGEQTLH
jgi:predicted nucleotidyltransferase